MSRAGTRIERVRLHGDALDSTQARLQLGALLAGTDVRPSGLGPAALLCVRRVADPLPGAIRLDTRDARPPPEWERAFAATLERALRNAARPAREAVPAAAEAVLFVDRAELLACLARDARDGTMWARWWWRSLGPDLALGADPVVEAWLETPEHVPAALELLAARAEATAFVAALPLAAAGRIVDRVVEVFGLVELARVITALATPIAARRAVVGSAAPGVSPPTPPWRGAVPESGNQPLAPARELLLGVALALRRSPAAVRTAAFARAVQDWLAPDAPAARAARTGPEVVPDERVGPVVAHDEDVLPETHVSTAIETMHNVATPNVVEAPAGPAASPVQQPETAAQHSPSISQPAGDVDAARTTPFAAQPAPPPTETGAPLAPTHVPPPVARPGSEQSAPRQPTAEPRRRRPRSSSAPPPQEEREARRSVPQAPAPTPPPPEPLPESSPLPVETELAGVFYLLNLALFLGLYGDFTQPRKPGIALDPWDFLALVGPMLLDDPRRGDALWILLGRLAARGPRERPGTGFRPPRAWRTPRAWLEPFDADGDWRWSAAGGTLRIVHPAGFAVAAVPRTDEPPLVQLEREVTKLPRPRPTPRRCTLPREPSQPLARWVSRFAAYADARLRLALDLAPTDSLEALLLRHHARVVVSSTHVDVVLRLDELPLEIRFAGLDRTPGWIPAAGRFVALHFE